MIPRIFHNPAVHVHANAAEGRRIEEEAGFSVC